MFAIVLLASIAAVSAAPYYPGGPPGFDAEYHPEYVPRFRFNEDVFDTRRFWEHLATEMRQLDDMLADFYKRFPPASVQQKIEGNEYKITIPLRGYEEKDIVVKAREGMLMVQAVHRMPEGQNTYLDIKTLPPYVNVTGVWVFEDDVLKITFPLKPEAMTEATVTESTGTEGYQSHEERSKEAVEPHSDREELDADVGARGDTHKQTELMTNEVPRDRVEATTYSVDLKDEVEFVPVRY